MQAITDYAKLLLLPSSFQMLSTIKSTYFLSSLLERPLCCLAFITFFFVQFSRCKLQPLLKPDLKIQFLGS